MQRLGMQQRGRMSGSALVAICAAAVLGALSLTAGSASAQSSKKPYVYRPRPPLTYQQIGSIPKSPPPVAAQNERRGDWNGDRQGRRACGVPYRENTSATAPYTMPMQYTMPTYTLPNYGAGQSTPFTPPVPAQVTPSQQMIAQMDGVAPAGQAQRRRDCR